jgi:hypothetical protein
VSGRKATTLRPVPFAVSPTCAAARPLERAE